jgi:serine/threonine protein kinase
MGDPAAARGSPESSGQSRYERLVKIASGGMATVFVGRLRGAMGFEQLVAIKRPHAHLLEAPDLKRSLLAEAKVASRIRHANVVAVRDIEGEGEAVVLVMDYVEGASLHELLYRARNADRHTTISAGLQVVQDLCAGLQAVHDLTDDEDRPLGLVHRDVSPQNVLVGLDGVSRLADFGIAKSLHAVDTSTREGTVKGKFSYMAPEYLQGVGLDHRADIFAVGVVLWEILTNQRLFDGAGHVDIIRQVLSAPIKTISEQVPELGTMFDDVVMRALARDPAERFEHASDLGDALAAAVRGTPYDSTQQDVARFVREQVGERLAERRRRVKECMGGGASSSSVAGTAGQQTESLSAERLAGRPAELPPVTGVRMQAEAEWSEPVGPTVQTSTVVRRRRLITVAASAFGIVSLTAVAALVAIDSCRHEAPSAVIAEPVADPTPEPPRASPVVAEPTAQPAEPAIQPAPEPMAKAADKPDKAPTPTKVKKAAGPIRSTAPSPVETPRPHNNPY